jgi:hypothetical protein
MCCIDQRVVPDIGGAVVDQGVVEVGLGLESVHLAHVFEKQSAAALDRALAAVDIDVFRRVLTVIGTQTDHVALVGHHVIQLVLAEEALDRGIGLALFLAGFDRNGEVVAAGKGEADQGVGDGRTHPIDRHQVYAFKFGEIIGLVVPGRRVIGFAAVGKVADVVYRYHVAVDCRVGQFGHIRLPVAVVGRLDTEPPRKQDSKQHKVGSQRAPAPAAKAECRQGQ